MKITITNLFKMYISSIAKYVLQLILCVGLSDSAFSQTCASTSQFPWEWPSHRNWFFGVNNRGTFNAGTLNFSTFTGTDSYEGTTIVSNDAGDLLFLANGVKVWNAAGTETYDGLLSGQGGTGKNSAVQGVITVKHPLIRDRYFMLTTDDALDGAGAYGLNFFTFNNAGNLVAGPTKIFASTTEGIAATKHANGVDIWITIHEPNSRRLRAYLLTCSGTLSAAVITDNVAANVGAGDPMRGGMKFSPNGATFAEAYGASGLTVMRFNNATGVFSNAQAIGNPALGWPQAYDVEFSPNGNRLYVSTLQSVSTYNLATFTVAAIRDSELLVASGMGNFGALEMGADGRLYYHPGELRSISGNLNAGTGLAISAALRPNNSRLGLPVMYLPPDENVRISSQSALCVSDAAVDLNTNFVCLGTTAEDGTNRYSGTGITNAATGRFDPATAGVGNHTITFTRCDATHQITIEVTECGCPAVTGTPTISGTATFCAGNNTTLTGNVPAGNNGYYYQWYNVTTNTSLSTGTISTASATTIASPTITTAGTYRFRLVNDVANINDNTCYKQATQVVTINPTPATPEASSNTAVCVGGTLNLSTDDVPTATYAWTGPDSYTATGRTPSRTPVTTAMAGDYRVRITVNGCQSAQSAPHTVVVNTVPAQSGTISIPSPLCKGTNGIAVSVPAVTGATGYTWSYTGTGIAINGTGRERTIDIAANATDGNLTVTADNICGSSTPRTIAITLNDPVSITAQPSATPATICSGSTSALSVTATGSGTLSYQWKQGTTDVGTNTASYTTAALTTATTYTVEITNACGTVTSNPVTVNIRPALAITTQPQAITACEGTNQTLSVVAIGAGTPNYQWKQDGTDVGTNSASLILSPLATSHAGSYVVEITDDCGTVTSTPITVTVNELIVITTQPEATGGCVGSSALLNVVATGTSPITYAWEKLSPTTAVGTNNATLNFASLTAGDAGDYRVIVSNSCGNVTSATATVSITLNETPSVSLAVDENQICDGASIELTATPTGGGTAPQYTFTETTLGTIGTANQTSNTVSTTLANTTDAVITRTFTVSMLSNSTCIGGATNPVTATITVDVDPQAATANITQNDQTICVDNIALTADPIATGHTGTWSKTSVTGSSAIDNNGAVSNLDISESSIFRYTVKSPLELCQEDTDEVTITRAGNLTDPSPVSAQSATRCETATAPTLNGVTLQTGETGTWSATAPATIDANGQTGNLQVGANTFTYTIANPSSGCNPQTANVVITIDAVPVITLPIINAVCAPNTVNITTTATPSSSTITYHQGTGGTGTIVTTPENMSTSGNYSIRAVNGTCSAFQDVVVEVNPTPAFTVTQPSAQCEGTYDLSTAVSGITPAGATLSYHTALTGGTQVTNSTTSSGTYYVQATASGCSSTRQPIIVRIDAQPTNVNLVDPTITTCQSTINLNAATPSPSTAVGEWVIMTQPVGQTASLTDSNSPTSQISGLILGQTTLEWRVSNGTCTVTPLTLTIDQVGSITNATIRVEGIEIAENFDICINNTVEVVGSTVASDETGTWTRHFTGNNPTQTFESTAVGITTLTWSIEKTTLSGCPRSEKTITITTYDAPSEEFRANRNVICEVGQGDIILYPQYNRGDQLYIWSRIDEDGNVFPVTSLRDTVVLSQPTQSGLYQLTTTHRVCTNTIVATNTQFIKIYEQPRLQMETEYLFDIRDNGEDQFKVYSTGLEIDSLTYINWTGLFIADTKELEAIVRPTIDGLFTYSLTVATGVGIARCIDSMIIQVTYRLPLKIPNAFTPNGDNINDVWEIQGMGAYPDAVMRIYNRWGNLVFERFGGYTQPWNGTNRNGGEMAIGTYYYILDLNDTERTVKTGDVTILR